VRSLGTRHHRPSFVIAIGGKSTAVLVKVKTWTSTKRQNSPAKNPFT
jgi:hypothetical protein